MCRLWENLLTTSAALATCFWKINLITVSVKHSDHSTCSNLHANATQRVLCLWMCDTEVNGFNYLYFCVRVGTCQAAAKCKKKPKHLTFLFNH